MKYWPSVVSVALLTATCGLLHVLSYAEPSPAKKPFSGFPLSIAERWQGKEIGLDKEVLDALKLTDYMMRLYVGLGEDEDNAEEDVAPVWLYVGYYQSQRTGSTYHSPKNCLPGAGWQFDEASEVPVMVAANTQVVINRALVRKGTDRQLILYWYHDRGRVIASEYWAKGYMVWDAVMKHRTDGALVRVSIPVTTTPDEAYRTGLAFVTDIWPLLNDHMPFLPGKV
ncbi:MAG TPA: EpsI family protein [Nitrospiraceae bacterium]|nr:EpsI family protein [Nitrospiraceae bacterium]